LALLPAVLFTASAADGDVRIDAAFPGGNIIVERMEGDTVFLQQDLRETRGQWFYWCFRVRGAAGRTLTFNFTRGNSVGTRGPAMSSDDGLTWRWLGTERAKPTTFTHAFPPKSGDVLFSVGMTYTEQNFRAFVTRVGGKPGFTIGTLGRSEKGRNVELLRIGKLEGTPAHRVAITARHHACEMMASYVLEGMIEGVLAGDETGRWHRENVAFLIVPFMDKDGVEEGLQGKNRTPHDPCRDYLGESLYRNVAAMKKLLPAWSEGRLRIALDLHCPTLRGKNADRIHLVGGLDPEIWKAATRFGEVLAATQAGPLVYRPQDNLPHGMAWNTLSDRRSFNLWAATLPGINFSTTLEFPFASVGDQVVDADSSRRFGRDLARAIREYLMTEVAQ